MNKQQSKQLVQSELKDELKEIVLARIGTMPDTISIAIGSDQLGRKELVQHVQKEDEIGKQIMDMELEYLRDLASGAIYKHE